MSLTIAPSALPTAKKNAFYHVQLVVTAGSPVGKVTWAVTSGSLPSWLTLDANSGIVSGKVPAALSATTFSATITATDSTPVSPLTGTCVTTTGLTIADGPDSNGFHTTEATRSNVTTHDQFVNQQGALTVSDEIQRAWPLTGPAQNS